VSAPRLWQRARIVDRLDDVRIAAFPSTLSLEDVIDDLLRPLGVPTIYNLPLGHGAHRATLPLGVRARLDADAGRLEVLESGVS
jgi:muramoyltetrapeptide carboxypeptidase LdcA involved in peptidoglycan recycling